MFNDALINFSGPLKAVQLEVARRFHTQWGFCDCDLL